MFIRIGQAARYLGALPTNGRNSYDPERIYRNWGLWRLLKPYGTTPDASKQLWRSSRALPPRPVAEETDANLSLHNPLERNNHDAVQQQEIDPG